MEHQKPVLPYFSIPIEAFTNPLLTPLEKNLFASLYYMNGKYSGGCFASNEYLADYNQVSISSIERALKTLESLGYIERRIKKTTAPSSRKIQKVRIRTQRKITINIHPIWGIVSQIWNAAFVQQDEEIREFWNRLLYGIEQLKLEKNINPQQIQNLIVKWSVTTRNNGHPPTKNNGYRPLEIRGILLDTIIGYDIIKTTLDEDEKTPARQQKIPSRKRTTIPPNSPNDRIVPSDFSKFWKLYPSKKRVDKGRAKTSWEKLCRKPDTTRPTWRQIRRALTDQKKTDRWKTVQFIPHPTTWINQQRWLDDPSFMMNHGSSNPVSTSGNRSGPSEPRKYDRVKKMEID